MSPLLAPSASVKLRGYVIYRPDLERLVAEELSTEHAHVYWQGKGDIGGTTASVERLFRPDVRSISVGAVSVKEAAWAAPFPVRGGGDHRGRSDRRTSPVALFTAVSNALGRL